MADTYFSVFWRLEVPGQDASTVRFLVKSLFVAAISLYSHLVERVRGQVGKANSCESPPS